MALLTTPAGESFDGISMRYSSASLRDSILSR